MVVHDREKQALWTEHRLVQEQQKQKKRTVKRTGRWSVLAVQSLACVVILLLVFLLRMAGGGAYEDLKQEFRSALANNELMAALAGLWQEEDAATAPEEADVKDDDFTEGESRLNQGVIGVLVQNGGGGWLPWGDV